MIALADGDSSGVVDVSLGHAMPSAGPRSRAHRRRPAVLLKHRLDSESPVREIRSRRRGPSWRDGGIDDFAFGFGRARIGFVATGKPITRSASTFDLLGIGRRGRTPRGRDLRPASWPLEPISLSAFALPASARASSWSTAHDGAADQGSRLSLAEHQRPAI